VLGAVKALLFKAPRKKGGQRVTDFIQDAGLIRAAFRQAYGIDLYRDRLHWIEFTELMNALPEGSRYAEVVGIRARPMPEPTQWNKKEREWLMKAKAEYAVEMTAEEQERSYQEGLHNMAMSLHAIAQKGDGTDGE
jgi:hypothetical protein